MVKLRHFLPALLCLSAYGQLNRGTLTGVVTDPSGAAVPSVTITSTHVETGTSATTSTTDGGNYTLPSLLIGTCRVTFEAKGFKRAVREKLTLPAGATMRLDVTLEPRNGAGKRWSASLDRPGFWYGKLMRNAMAVN